MAYGDPYISAADFRARVGSIATATDAAIAAVLVSASRQIDNYCGRRFDQTDSAEARLFSARYGSPYLAIDDAVSVAEIATDYGSRSFETVLDPANYALIGSDDIPGAGVVDRIQIYSPASLPVGRDLVRVTAVWGWPAVPAPIVEACFLIGNRAKALWEAPFGQTGAGEMGSGLNMTSALTPLIQQMINPYRVITL